MNYNNGIQGLTQAKIRVYLETQEDNKNIYQNFRLVTSNISLLKYFIDDKYLGYYTLDDSLKDYYIGNGESIIFRDKSIYNNLIIVTYEKLTPDAKYDSSEKNFEVYTTIPYNNGCLSCEYFVKKDRVCQYIREVGITIKNNCNDFKQKEE